MRKLRSVIGLGILAAVGVAAGSAQSAFGGAISWNTTFFNDVGLNATDYGKFQSNVNTTLNYYTSTWSAHRAVTVTIEVHAGNTGLGTTTAYYSGKNYQDYRNALATTGTSANDAVALTFLPNTANNPVNSNTQMSLPLALQRALGFSTPGVPWDASIVLNTTLMTLDRNDPMVPGTYDLQQVMYHELNEVLGFTSALNGVPNSPITVPSGSIQAADLFRYKASGTRSFTSDVNEAAYLSINGGVTVLANFNTNQGGDRQDFNGQPSPSVQDAFSTPNIRLDNGPAEVAFLDVIGYNQVPEPASLGLLMIAGIALVRRHR